MTLESEKNAPLSPARTVNIRRGARPFAARRDAGGERRRCEPLKSGGGKLVRNRALRENGALCAAPLSNRASFIFLHFFFFLKADRVSFDRRRF